MAIDKLPDHAGNPELAAKINELVDAVNMVGQAVTDTIVWGDTIQPSGWKWEKQQGNETGPV